MTTYPTTKLILDKTLAAALLVMLSPVFGFLFAAMFATISGSSGGRSS